MFQILLILFALILVSYSPLPLSKTRELVRPQSVYLGSTLLVLVFLWSIIKLPEFLDIWSGLFILLIGIVGVIYISRPKIVATADMVQEKSTPARLINIVTWTMLLAVLGVLLYVAKGVFSE